MSFRYSARRLRSQRLAVSSNARQPVRAPTWQCRGVASTANAEKCVDEDDVGPGQGPLLTTHRVLFPGALNSEFTNTLEFLRPSTAKGAISTYRCLNQYGEVIDKIVGADTTDEEALELYKNMVKRTHAPHLRSSIPRA